MHTDSKIKTPKKVVFFARYLYFEYIKYIYLISSIKIVVLSFFLSIGLFFNQYTNSLQSMMSSPTLFLLLAGVFTHYKVLINSFYTFVGNYSYAIFLFHYQLIYLYSTLVKSLSIELMNYYLYLPSGFLLAFLGSICIGYFISRINKKFRVVLDIMVTFRQGVTDEK